MGLRYLIAIPHNGRSHSTNVQDAAIRAGLLPIDSASPFQIFLNTAESWARLPNARGLVIGDLFQRGDGARSAVVGGGKIATNAIDTDALLAKYWGGYVALWLCGSKVEVLRDPSGALPAYYVRREDGWYIASDAPLLVETGLYVPEIAWCELAESLYANGASSERTALSGVLQVLPGAALALTVGEGKTRLCWSPWDYVGACDPGPEKLRAITINCVGSWRSRYGPIVVSVSGGLDSSIVACSLGGNANMRAITISTGDAQGDESSYAAMLCHALKIPLDYGHYEMRNIDLTKPSLPHRPTPAGMAQLQAYDAVVKSAVRQHRAEAFFSGLGGDNVFYFSRSTRALVDRFLESGLTLGTLKTLCDTCRLTGARPLDVIRAAWQVPRRPGPKYSWSIDGRFLHPDLIAQFNGKQIHHPWLEAPDGCLPGRHAHIAMIVRAHNFLECHDPRWAFASVHPLMSQPIIESVLSVPSWAACEGGIDRARARNAFAGDLPASVLNRRMKGSPDGFAHRVVRTRLETIRQRLLDGHLVRNGIVYRPSLEHALTDEAGMRSSDCTRLLLLLDTEAWIENWTSSVMKQA